LEVARRFFKGNQTRQEVTYMAAKKQAKKRSDSRGGRRSVNSDSGMPDGDMNRPFKSGLMEMPSGGDTSSIERAQGEASGGPSPMEGNLMPGESRAPASGSLAEMPGGTMTST
jgi:hypothetical protein